MAHSKNGTNNGAHSRDGGEMLTHQKLGFNRDIIHIVAKFHGRGQPFISDLVKSDPKRSIREIRDQENNGRN